MRYALMAVWLLLSPAALAEVSVGVRISVPGVSIGINVPAYPDLVLVPGYPVYYAPDLDANYFFYDGLYWIFVDDHWYVSDWYNGPWGLVEPDYVPVFLLRIPVFYYMRPPVFFHAWVPAEPPHWGEHWGHDWARRHADWTRWSPGEGPAPAPLPDYQRHYTGNRYPQPEDQRVLRERYYHYREHESGVRPYYERREERADERRGVPVQALPAPRMAPMPAPVQGGQAIPERRRATPVITAPHERATPRREIRVETVPGAPSHNGAAGERAGAKEKAREDKAREQRQQDREDKGRDQRERNDR